MPNARDNRDQMISRIRRGVYRTEEITPEVRRARTSKLEHFYPELRYPSCAR